MDGAVGAFEDFVGPVGAIAVAGEVEDPLGHRGVGVQADDEDVDTFVSPGAGFHACTW